MNILNEHYNKFLNRHPLLSPTFELLYLSVLNDIKERKCPKKERVPIKSTMRCVVFIKPTYDFSTCTPPPTRKLPVWHTLYFMRIHGQTKARAVTVCGTEYWWHTVV